MTEGVFNLTLLVTLGAIIPSAALGAFVYFRGQDGFSKNVFVASSFSIILWAIVNYLSLQPSEHALVWIRLVLFFAVLLTYMFSLFCHIFLGQGAGISKKKLIFLSVLAGATMIATQTAYVFRSIEIRGVEVIPTPGPLIPLFAITVLVLFLLGGIELIGKIRRFVEGERARLIYVATGYFSMFALLIFTQFVLVAAFQNTFFIKFGPVFALPFLVLTTYAIFKHHLFNIRVVATEMFTILIVFVFLLNIFLPAHPNPLWTNIILFCFVLLFGILLIRGTLREIRELERISSAKSEFISIASHQLRTPLTIVKGYLSLLLEGSYGTLNEKAGEVLKKIYVSNERLIGVVNDILDVSRIESGRLEYTFAKVSISNMLTEIVEEFHIAAEMKGLVISCDLPQDPSHFYARADEEKLRQTFLNLIDNAIKYTEKGHIEVRLAKAIRPQYMRIGVRDTGVGLSLEDKKKIFQRFSRGKGGANIDTTGTGLGLFIAKRIVEDHGGRIWAESEGPGTGSTFIVVLPMYQEGGEVVPPSGIAGSKVAGGIKPTTVF